MNQRDEQQGQEALPGHEARLLLDTAFDGIVISQDGVVADASERLLAASGYSRDEVIGRPLTDFVAEEYRDLIRERQAAGFEGQLDAVVIDRDGRRFDVEIVTRNYLVDGRPSRITAIRDVTDKRRLQEQLWHAQKMESVGQLASVIAHDFRNLLTVIRGYGQELQDQLSEPLRSDAQEIVKAAEAGAALTRQLLAYSRRHTPEEKPIDINAVVRSSEQMVRRLLGGHIRIEIDLAPDAGHVVADPVQLQQVILNLATNARDAMPAGGVLLIRTRNTDVTQAQARHHFPARPGEYVTLLVTDSGTGITDEVKTRLFDPFFTTKEPGRGTGIGLAAVQDIVQRTRGFIVVDSTLGAGSTFAIHLPMLASP